MQRNKVETELSKYFPSEIISPLLDCYVKGIGEYRKGNWQYTGNEIGQFIEYSRRLLEFVHTSTYTPLKNKLVEFSTGVLNLWENNTTVIEEYRIVIPRLLYAMACIRNKRGMVHPNHINPNKMDATWLVNSSKWIISEFLRIASDLSHDITTELIESIMNKETTLFWNVGGLNIILDTRMVARDKVLCQLYQKDSQTDNELQRAIEYKNKSKFIKIINDLHQEKLIHHDGSICRISPKGIEHVENILKDK